MSVLRRLLFVVAGWILGVFVTLAWIWLSEDKGGATGVGGLVAVMAIVTTACSLVILGSTVFNLAVFAIEGREM